MSTSQFCLALSRQITTTNARLVDGPQPGELLGVDVVGGLIGLTGWLGSRRRRNKPAAVPDAHGLFYPVGLEAAGRHGLHGRSGTCPPGHADTSGTARAGLPSANSFMQPVGEGRVAAAGCLLSRVRSPE